MNDIEQAQLTLLNEGIPIIVKCHNTMADTTPVNQVVLYYLLESSVKDDGTNIRFIHT